MHKRAFLTSILGLAGSAALTSLNLASARANTGQAAPDSGATNQNGVTLAQYGGYDDGRRRERHDDDDDERRRRRRREDEEDERRRRRREEFESCRRRFGEEVCRLRFRDLF